MLAIPGRRAASRKKFIPVASLAIEIDESDHKSLSKPSFRWSLLEGAFADFLSALHLEYEHMYSLAFSEPVGTMAGALAGRLGARIGRRLAPEGGWSRYICVGLAVCATHYAASTCAKTLLSAGALDLPGAVVGATVTTPLAAVAHGVIEGVLEALA